LAAGRAVASEQLSSLAGVWPQFQALLPSVQFSEDPLAASCFLAIGAAMSVMSGNYRRGLHLADHALAICKDLRLDFGLGTCLAHRAAAEIGMRQFAKAQRTLRAFERTPICREDPFFRLEGLKLRARLLASQGALEEAIATQTELPTNRSPDRPLGVFLSTISILYAALGRTTEAAATASAARDHGSSVEMRYCSLLAEAIATEADKDTFRRRATHVIVECGRAHYLDGLVFAYRVCPALLGIEDLEARNVLQRAVSAGHDHDLARQAGIDVSRDEFDDPLSVLTPREREVLALLSQGMTNAEIAGRLYISPSTAKVHVRHILRKLGARTRLQAVLRSQEVLEAEG
jgi:DNA-binding CsgD family transcriptional regulator